jgi:hypothetical protein
MKSVAYVNMIPTLLQPIKEQQQEMDDLKKPIAENIKYIPNFLLTLFTFIIVKKSLLSYGSQARCPY